MWITKKHISRRTLLRGAGAAVALPFLESMVPAATPIAQTAASPAPRLVGLFVCHGMAAGYWVPDKIGSGFDFKPILRPLEPFRKDVTVFSGLHARSAESPPGITGADHFVAAAYLCANQPKKTIGADVHVGKTIDQIIADKIGQDNLMPSMQLAVEDPGANSSNCGEGYSCAYSNSIAWRSENSPILKEVDPKLLFDRLFAGGNANETAEARARREVKSLYLLARGLENDIREAAKGGTAVLLTVTALGGTMGYGSDLPTDFFAGHGGIARPGSPTAAARSARAWASSNRASR